MSEDVDTHIIERYDLHKRLGKGAYGIVWKAVDRRVRETVALKKIFDAFRNQTDAQRTFREIMFLQEFGRHPNIIKLYNVLKADNNRDIYLVFEFMEADLHNVIKKLTILKDIHKQYIMCQLFRAVRFLHSGNVLHRDLKPSNVLLDADCRVKLADFGLARSLSQIEDYPEGQNMPELTEYVATRWYRSPEILLAAKCYTKGVDMWSLGCILAEMLLGHALFPGTSTINQIERIMNTISRPSKLDIESIGSQYASSVLEKMPRRPQKPLELYLTNSDHQAIDLVQRLLIFAPHKRLNVDQCLVHPYVLQFHSPIDEPALNYDILLPLPDHIQLSIDDYRNKLYEMIQENRTYVKRIQHNRVINNNSNQKFKSHNTTTTTMATTTTTTTTMTTTTTTMTATPLMKTNGQTIATNGRLSSVIRRSSSNNAIRTMKQQSVMEPKAPIAQAECSDTDYDTARSINRPVSIDKPKNIDTTMIENRQSRERAQSVETPQNGTVFRERTASSSSKVRPRRRSQHRTGIFSSFRKSTQHFAS
ncbi:Extracellular signal-regulated kinase 2 domain protein [Brugia pahangi]